MRASCAVPAFRTVCGGFRGTSAWLVAALTVICPPTRADVLHLANGRTVEGQILERTEQGYRLRTVAGIVTLPAEIVERIEQRPSPFEQYEQRQQQAAQTPAAQMELADWCAQRGLKAERRKHLKRALELDGDYAPARRALGFVRIGRFWVDGRSPSANAQRQGVARPAEQQRDEQQKLVAAIQSQWFQRIRAIRTALLDNPKQRLVEEGRAKILRIRDPLAILPLARELSRGGRACRQVLVETLSRFPHDEATLNLAALALVDPDEGIRADALLELRRRDDPRVAAQFREALRGQDWLVGRAATGLGVLRSKEAIPDLINTLTARRRKRVEVPVSGYINSLPYTFNGPSQVIIGGNVAVVYSPNLGIVLNAAAPASGVHNEWRMRDVTVFRTEVLEALKQITGQNFAFDQAAWRRWYEE